MIINEWQLSSGLNTALQTQQRADFALLLAMLSPAVDEFAEFKTPIITPSDKEVSLYQKLSIQKCRNFAYDENDNVTLLQHAKALSSDGLSQLKLCQYLKPAPLTQYDEPKRLDNELLQNLSLHCRRHVQGNAVPSVEADVTALYDVLQQLNTRPDEHYAG